MIFLNSHINKITHPKINWAHNISRVPFYLNSSQDFGKIGNLEENLDILFFYILTHLAIGFNIRSMTAFNTASF